MNDSFTQAFIQKYTPRLVERDRISMDTYKAHNVNQGLRDEKGNGLVVGLTNISRADGFEIENGKRTACPGKLWYRGIDIKDLIDGYTSCRFGYESAAFLLLFGDLPTQDELDDFIEVLDQYRTLPPHFVRDIIMHAPSNDLMRMLTRSVLSLGAYDDNSEDTSPENVLRQCLMLISQFPILVIYAYQAYNHYLKGNSLYLHRPKPGMSTSEILLSLLRPDRRYTDLEAWVLEVELILHMEHGGGNNSTFVDRVVSSTGADTYSTIAAAIASLKGPKHGGQILIVPKMMADLEENIASDTDMAGIKRYLTAVLDCKAFDHQGKIYGIDNPVYSISDPRADILRTYAKKLAAVKGCENIYNLYAAVADLAPKLLAERDPDAKPTSANIDFFSGFVYHLLDIPEELYTPMIAVGRIVGWSAHRIEELINCQVIMRPAYESLTPKQRPFVPIEDRKTESR
jgi:citrate synthase